MQAEKALFTFGGLDKSAFFFYRQATFHLDDLTDIHDDPFLASLRRSLTAMRKSQGHHCTEMMFKVYEVSGLCQEICKRQNLTNVWFLELVQWECKDMHRWLYEQDNGEESVSLSSATNESFRRFLLTEMSFGWSHVGNARENGPNTATSCFCPTTILLQYAVKRAKVMDWLAAALGSDAADASLIASAWGLARKDPQVGKMTADVVVLVQMGFRLYDAVAGIAEKDASMKTSPLIYLVLLGDGRKELKRKVKGRFVTAMSWLEDLSGNSMSEKERLLIDKDLSEAQIQAKRMEPVKAMLLSNGELYAQCIEEGTPAHDRVAICDIIRKLFCFLLSNAVPCLNDRTGKIDQASLETFLEVVDELARTE